MKIFKKAQIASAVMLATAGLAIGTAQADSYLAPLVVSTSSTQTYFAFKMRGAGVADEFSVSGGVNPNTSRIHYYHIQKWNNAGTAPVDSILHGENSLLDNPAGGCKVSNTSGNGSSWDMILQNFRQTAPAGTADPFILSNGNPGSQDQSQPAGWISALNPKLGNYLPFVGMTIIDDVGNANIEPSNGRRVNEGDMSGFVYIVNLATGAMVDYKLFNNPFSKRSGDFKTNWISKTSIDWMWLPANNPGGIASTERTAWYTAVTGEGMSALAEQQGAWNESVKFTQTLANYDAAMDIRPIFRKNGAAAPGAYNNDEQVLSGPKDLDITCLGLYDRTAFLTLQQIQQTYNGGWKRSHIVPVNASGVDNVKAHGAITFRTDIINGTDLGINIKRGPLNPTLTVETSGHLSTSKNKQHPNRGY